MRPDPQSGGPRIFTRGDGTAGSSFEITAETVRFLSSRGEDTGGGSYDDNGGYSGGGAQEEDDIPF